jgi:hypothetical protein
MTAPATKDDLKATVADLHESIDLQAKKLTIRFALMMVAFSEPRTLTWKASRAAGQRASQASAIACCR